MVDNFGIIYESKLTSDYENQIVGQIRFLISALAPAKWVLGNRKGGPFWGPPFFRELGS